MLSLMSEVCVILVLALVESRKMVTAAANATMVMAIPMINSTSVKPDVFFMSCSSNPRSRELPDKADQGVLPRQRTHGVGHGDGDLPQRRFTGNVYDGDRAAHVPQGHHDVIRSP